MASYWQLNFCGKLPGLMQAPLYFRAQLYLFFKQHARALQALQTLLRQYPEHQRAWSEAGFLYAEKGRLPDAISAFERSLALKPDDAATLFNLGFALQRGHRHEDAIGRFERAIELQPNLDRAWYGLGLSLAHVERHAEAATKFQEAARLQPLNPYPRYQLAGAWFRQGEHERVRAEYRRVKGFDPKIAAQISRDFGVPPDPD